MYLQYQALKNTDKMRNIVFYSICALYLLSVVVFVCDIANAILPLFGGLDPMRSLHISLILGTSFGCCEIIAQFILIYRCWIVWGRNIRVVIIPSTLACTCLVIWLVGGSSTHVFSDSLVTPYWAYRMILSALVLSLTVNALVTGLIVFRIFKVFREVKVTLDDQILGTTGGSKLRRTIFVLIESGMALFSIQLARLVVSIVFTGAAFRALNIIIAIHEMLNGITPTIILVRTSMGLSFHDEKSMEEVAIGSLRFASNHLNSVQEMESIGTVGQDRLDSRDVDDIGVQQSNDIENVER